MPAGEICILAGGLSSRMGRNKGRLRLGEKTLLRHGYDTARRTPWPIRLIRHDLVPRCGPLGGIYTALRTSRFERVLFLACDMPFVTVELLERLMASQSAAFAACEGKAGFPFLLPIALCNTVERQLAKRQYSLQALARICEAAMVDTPSSEVFNLNTPEDLRRAKDSLT
jgi:molybdopterin-guanine dinucleotide biosynthesis protein A